MHTARAACLRIERTLEDSAEDSRRDLAPVEVVAGFAKEQVAQFIGELRDRLVLQREQATIDIRESGEFGFEVWVALIERCVEHLKEIEECTAELRSRNILDIVAKLLFSAKDTCVFGIEAEHKAHAQHIEAMERFGRCRVKVLGKEAVVDHADDFACFFGDLQLAVEVGIAHLHEESEAVVLLVEVLEEDDLWLAIGLLHVINIPRTEIADHNPTRALGVWEFGSIAFGLLERREQRAIRLRNGLTEVDMAALLLNEHLGRRDIAVNETGVAEFDLPLEGNEVADVLDVIDIGE